MSSRAALVHFVRPDAGATCACIGLTRNSPHGFTAAEVRRVSRTGQAVLGNGLRLQPAAAGVRGSRRSLPAVVGLHPDHITLAAINWRGAGEFVAADRRSFARLWSSSPVAVHATCS
jgi:hypothetical protein